MLQFYYDFLDVHVDRVNFQYQEMDTDSAYFAIAGTKLDDLIKPEFRPEYEHKLNGYCHVDEIEANDQFWFPRTCCGDHKFFDRRTSGLFKLEFQGSKSICLCSKTYIVQDGDKYKMSTKGLNKKSVNQPYDKFEHVLQSGQGVSVINRGFRSRNNQIHTYEQERKGLTYFYCKRKVLEDGIGTEPLDLILSPWIDYNLLPFQGSTDLLSNMYSCQLSKHGLEFNSSEQLYQYEKALFHNQTEIMKSILKSENGYEAKTCGSKVKVITRWHEVKMDKMREIIKLKLQAVPEVGEILKESGNKCLVEANKWDRYWGSGLDKAMVEIISPTKWPGRNDMGKLWMELRQDLVQK
jgi:ribA/ribD-fused uncharacterized protein